MRPPEEQTQMDLLLRAAIERVAKNAETASDRDISLACAGWLGQKIDRLSVNNGHKNGRKALVVKVVVPAAVWTSIGLGAMSLLEKLVK